VTKDDLPRGVFAAKGRGDTQRERRRLLRTSDSCTPALVLDDRRDVLVDVGGETLDSSPSASSQRQSKQMTAWHEQI
jgi:hypothetical protein